MSAVAGGESRLVVLTVAVKGSNAFIGTSNISSIGDGKSDLMLKRSALFSAKCWPGSAVLYTMLQMGLDFHQPWRSGNHGKSFIILPANN